MENYEKISSMLTTRKVAYLLNIDTSTVRRWCHQGKIKGYRIGPAGGWKFRRGEVAMLFLERAVREYLENK